MGVGGIDWVDLAQDRDRWASSCECGDEPSVSQSAGNFLTSRERVSFSGRTLLHGVG
jgi:hypothetical protein